jgi:hypothetical protein
MPIKTLKGAFVEVKIDGSRNIGDQLLSFEWKTFVNSGYIIRAKFSDPFFRILEEIGATGGYLAKARNGPTPVTFKIGRITLSKTSTTFPTSKAPTTALANPEN